MAQFERGPMTTPPVNELMRVVRHALRLYRRHYEYEDIYSEGLLHAWEVLTRPEADWRKWTTIAHKAARWQALEYLRQRRSGRLDARKREEAGEAVRPIPLSTFFEADLDEFSGMATDGGIPEAEERLQDWIDRKHCPRTDPILAGISERDRRIWTEYQQGRKQQDLAGEWGITGTRVWQIIEGVRNRYREANSRPKERVTQCRHCGHAMAGANPRRRYCDKLCKSRAQEQQRRGSSSPVEALR